MNYCYVLLFFLLLQKPAAAQQQPWESYPIDNQLAIRFPTAPEELSVPGTMSANGSPNKDNPQAQASRAFRAEDSTAIYIVVSIPFTDSLYLAQPVSQRENYYRTRSIPQMMTQAHGEMLEQEIGTKVSMDSFTIKYRVSTADGKSRVKYARVLTTNRRIYQLYFVPKDTTGEKGSIQRTQFFDVLPL